MVGLLASLLLGIAAAQTPAAPPPASSLPLLGDMFLTASSTGCADYADKGPAILPGRFTASDPVPPYVSAGATEVGLGKPSYFHAPARDGDVWIINFDRDPLCFVQAYGAALGAAETTILDRASQVGWQRDEKLTAIRGSRNLRIFETMRGGRRVQMVLLTPIDYQRSQGARPLAISGYVEAVDKGK